MHRRWVVGDRITYVGLDVHKEGIVVAEAEGGIRGEVREYGRIANTAGTLDLISCSRTTSRRSKPPRLGAIA
jgi:hypothetical protein